MDYHHSKASQLTNYREFNKINEANKSVLQKLYNEIQNISPFTFSFSKITEIGHIMCVFYKLYDNDIYNDALLYSFGFNGYLNTITQVNININENKITNPNKKRL